MQPRCPEEIKYLQNVRGVITSVRYSASDFQYSSASFIFPKYSDTEVAGCNTDD